MLLQYAAGVYLDSSSWVSQAWSDTMGLGTTEPSWSWALKKNTYRIHAITFYSTCHHYYSTQLYYLCQNSTKKIIKL